MFIRQRRNKSGSTSVQLIKKDERGINKVVETVGCTSCPEELGEILLKAKIRLSELRSNPRQLQLPLKFSVPKEDQIISEYLESEESEFSVLTIGPELVLGSLFERIGFSQIKSELFKDIVIARLVYPGSKLKTCRYLRDYKGIDVDVSRIYRFLDKFYVEHKKTVEEISFRYTEKILGKVLIAFYDMTTLYYESEDEDDLRRIGFSKDGKFQKPQIMLGLLVGENAYPLAYDIFEGNTFEGSTLIPIINKFKERYNIPNPVIVADSGLLSKNNIKQLVELKYEFILGARIKNESSLIKEKIISKAKNIKDNQSVVIQKDKATRLIISYSDKRAKKDSHNRQRGISKLRERVKSGKLTKKQINNRGYNKFLTLNGQVEVAIDEEKILKDEQWDGLKGFVTNSKLEKEAVIANYQHLWQIEKAFRISKTDLRIRPIFHRKRDRIEAHICIAFVAYTIFKELERILKIKNSSLSPQKAIEATKTIYQLKCKLPKSRKIIKKISKLNDAQKEIMQLGV